MSDQNRKPSASVFKWLLPVSLVLLGLTARVAAQTFELSDSFATGSNPSGPWQYGESVGLGGRFTAYLTNEKRNDRGVVVWSGKNAVSSTPSVYFNQTDTAVALGSPVIPPHAAGFHPGPGDRVSTVRFTAQKGGAHYLHATVYGQDVAGTSTRVGVSHNGQLQGAVTEVQLWGPTSFRLIDRVITMAPGDHVDISVSNNGPFSNDSTGLAVRIVTPQDPWTPALRGFADIHNHQFAHKAFGGRFLFGDARGGLVDAMSPARDGEQHGPGHALETLGAKMDDRFGLFLGNGGYPGFENWPSFRDTDHNKVYKDWLHRAVAGGLRLMVMFAVDSPKLCENVINDRRLCADEQGTVEAQLREAFAMQAEVDNESGGTGKGWYRIVKTPAEARQVIAEAKLAVVLGVETMNALGTVPSSTMDRIAQLRNEFAVRHIFPIHQGDNLVGAASYFEAQIQRQGNVPLDGDLIDIFGWFGPNPARYVLTTTDCKQFEKYGRCNANGLTSLGKTLISELIRAGLLVDVDHMSNRALVEAVDIARSTGAPLVASHAGFNEVARTGGKIFAPWPIVRPSTQDHEGQFSREELNSLVDSGGMVGVILSQGKDLRDIQMVKRSDGKASVPHRCGRSSETFAQAYLYAVDQSDGQAVAIGTDINTPSLLQPGPRFGSGACPGGKDLTLPGWAPELSYPFTARGSGQSMSPMTSGNRTFNFNVDGFATMGQLPDLIADLEVLGVPAADLEPLFHSAEAYVRMWEKADAAARALPGRLRLTIEPPQVPADADVTFKVGAEDIYFGRSLVGGRVHVNDVDMGALGAPITMRFDSVLHPPECHFERDPPEPGNPYPRPRRVCTEATRTASSPKISVRFVPGFLDPAPQGLLVIPEQP